MAPLAVWPRAGALRWAKRRAVVTDLGAASGAGAAPGVGARPARRQLRRPGVRREITHKVKVSPEQEEKLVAAAAVRGVTVSRLLVESALAGGADVAAARAHLAGELFRLGRLMAKIGLNVNQLAKVGNATGSVPPEAPAAFDALTRTAGRIDGLLEEMGGTR